MKKICSYIFIIVTYASATGVEAEIGINVGMTSTKNTLGSKFRNPTIVATYQDNRYVVMPRFDLEYVNIADNQVDALVKGSVNGVYEFENNTVLTPYVVAGVGYEDVKGGIKDVFESHPFIQGGGGLVYEAPNEYQIKAKVEGKMLQILGGNGEDNEASVTAGITVPVATFKSVTKPKPNVVAVQPVVRVVPAIKVVPINKNECSIKISAPDMDRDGVENRFDQCPNTPCDFTVDSHGCPIKTTLKINFETNSAEIDFHSMPKVYNFAQILLKNRDSQIQILGHTDSRGSASKNLLLSERRAEAVVQVLIGMGVSPSRIHAEGRGERMPIASNDTSCGRKSNRRIEAVLSYPKGRQ
ncbi:OmpA family protein [bacterium]|nr:OmpA family protein [bacterium]MBU1957769.1 OmpA family protein [bacterium]